MKQKNYEMPEAEIVILSRVDMLVTSDEGFGGKDDVIGGGSGSGGGYETPVLPNY